MANRIRVLCLHGFTSNGQVHSHQMRHITKLLPECDFLFPSGPHHIDTSSGTDTKNGIDQAWTDMVKAISTDGHRAWWVARDATASDGKQNVGGYEGIETSLRFLNNLIEESGPVDAICGFSQGACLAGMLCALLSPKLSEHPLRAYLSSQWVQPKTGIIISGFRARFPQYDSLYDSPIEIPMLHVVGESDALVIAGRSDALAEVCSQPSFVRHPGGHDIPRSNDDRNQVVDYLRRQLDLDPARHASASM